MSKRKYIFSIWPDNSDISIPIVLDYRKSTVVNLGETKEQQTFKFWGFISAKLRGYTKYQLNFQRKLFSLPTKIKSANTFT